jgi:hypothetical protein
MVRCSDTTTQNAVDLSKKLSLTIGIPRESSTCFNKDPNVDTVELGGSLGLTQQSRSLVLSATYYLCTLVGLENDCHNQSVLSVTPIIVVIYYNNYYSDMKASNGYLDFEDHELFKFSAGFDLTVKIYFQKNVVTSDDNYIFSFIPLRNYTYYTTSKVEFIPTARSIPEIPTLLYSVELDKYLQIYHREYIKLDQLLANTMSVFSVLVLVFENLTKIFEFQSIEFYLMKKLYYFEPNDGEFSSITNQNKILVNKMKSNNKGSICTNLT